MTRADARRARRRPRRTGFTLIELLIVIAIIALLMALTAGAVFRTIGLQNSSNTRATLTSVQTHLNKQWSAAASRFQKETLPPHDPALATAYNTVVLPMAGGDSQRARVIWVKMRLKQEFPNTFAEALNPYPLPPLDSYVNYLGQLGYTTANTNPTAPQPFEASACLLMALTRGEGGNTTKVEDLGVSGGALKTFPAAAAGQNVQALVDGWGNPLGFCRWPTGSDQLNPSGPQPGNKNDPGDPTGLLTKVAWLNDPNGGVLFQQYVHALAQPDPNTTPPEPRTYRLAPLVASAGPDQQLGLDPITFASQGGASNDNIYPALAANP
jgi:prepilin-type N-terminal cleavage/methylation domain-containing protein